jgi:hypothetical protein
VEVQNTRNDSDDEAEEEAEEKQQQQTRTKRSAYEHKGKENYIPSVIKKMY